ncbi:MAG: 30S ribosomal protein S10 [Candidatus Pacearchaeota archaeon]
MRARIKLASLNIEELNQVVDAILDIAKKQGVVVRGPIPLPTQKLRITTRRSPCGAGTETYDKFEMRIHKRLIEVPAEEKLLHNIIRLPIPREVNIEIKMKEE